MDNIINILGENKVSNGINTDINTRLLLEQQSELTIESNLFYDISQDDQFNIEKQDTLNFRFYGKITPIINTQAYNKFGNKLNKIYNKNINVNCMIKLEKMKGGNKMNKFLKTLLLGFVVWVIPFIVSFFVWNPKINAPSVSEAWFYALMGVAGALSFAIAAYYQFKDISNETVTKGWATGIIWYIELVLLDLIFLVGLLGMTFAAYSHLLLAYLNPLILCVLIGYLKR